MKNFIIGLIRSFVNIAKRVIVKFVAMTMNWLKSQINSIISKINVEKVAVIAMDTIIQECGNEFSNIDADHCIVPVDRNNQVAGEVEFIDDKYNGREISSALGRDGMIIIEG